MATERFNDGLAVNPPRQEVDLNFGFSIARLMTWDGGIWGFMESTQRVWIIGTTRPLRKSGNIRMKRKKYTQDLVAGVS